MYTSNATLSVGKTLSIILKMAVGTFVSAFAFSKFLVPNNITPGGFSGIAAIFTIASGGAISAGLVSLLLNIPLFFAAFKKLNRQFFFFSALGTAMYSGAIELVKIIPYDIVLTNTLLYPVFGGALSGLGIGIIMRIGCSTGGSEILAALVNKRFPSAKLSTIKLSVDGVVLLLNAIVVSILQKAFIIESVLLSAITMFLSSRVIDAIVDGFRAAKAYYIISSRHKELSAEIMKHLGRAVTSFHGQGQYSGSDREMLMCILANSEVAQLRQIVFNVDKNAFMFCTSVKEAFGGSFAQITAPLLKGNKNVLKRQVTASAKASPNIKISKINTQNEEKE